MTGDDRDLYECFAAVRREEEARVPPFSIPSSTVHGWGLSGKLVAAAACLAMMIAAAVWLLSGYRVVHHGLNGGRGQAVASITSWKPETDFLLDTPGHELLEGVPAIGEWHGPVSAPGRGERHRHVSKQVSP
jgi:hypothetical protein